MVAIGNQKLGLVTLDNFLYLFVHLIDRAEKVVVNFVCIVESLNMSLDWVFFWVLGLHHFPSLIFIVLFIYNLLSYLKTPIKTFINPISSDWGILLFLITLILWQTLKIICRQKIQKQIFSSSSYSTSKPPAYKIKRSSPALRSYNFLLLLHTFPPENNLMYFTNMLLPPSTPISPNFALNSLELHSKWLVRELLLNKLWRSLIGGCPS